MPLIDNFQKDILSHPVDGVARRPRERKEKRGRKEITEIVRTKENSPFSLLVVRKRTQNFTNQVKILLSDVKCVCYSSRLQTSGLISVPPR